MCYQMPLKGTNHPVENHCPRASQSKPDSPGKLKEKANPKTYQRPVDSESHRLRLKVAGQRVQGTYWFGYHLIPAFLSKHCFFMSTNPPATLCYL